MELQDMCAKGPMLLCKGGQETLYMSKEGATIASHKTHRQVQGPAESSGAQRTLAKGAANSKQLTKDETLPKAKQESAQRDQASNPPTSTVFRQTSLH
eukprot:4063338-Amphidinium_carterae.2